MLWGTPILSAVLLLLFGIIYVNRGRILGFSYFIGMAISIFVVNNFPGSHLWPATPYNMIGGGIPYLWPCAVIALVLGLILAVRGSRKQEDDLELPVRLTLTVVLVLIVAPLLTLLDSHNLPMLPSDFTYLRQQALLWLMLAASSTPLFRGWEESTFE